MADRLKHVDMRALAKAGEVDLAYAARDDEAEKAGLYANDHLRWERDDEDRERRLQADGWYKIGRLSDIRNGTLKLRLGLFVYSHMEERMHQILEAEPNDSTSMRLTLMRYCDGDSLKLDDSTPVWAAW